MKQLDIVLIPPAFVWDSYLTSTNVTFDFDICDVNPKSSGSRDMTFYLVKFYLMNYFLVTDRQTDRG